MKPEYKEYTLPRTGDSNLEFCGTVIASAKSPSHRRHEASPTSKCHWFEVDVYQTKAGSFVTHIAYRWAGPLYREVNSDTIFVVQRASEIPIRLTEFEPFEQVAGFPSGENYAAKQKFLFEAINDDFDALAETVEQKLCELSRPERIA